MDLKPQKFLQRTLSSFKVPFIGESLCVGIEANLDSPPNTPATMTLDLHQNPTKLYTRYILSIFRWTNLLFILGLINKVSSGSKHTKWVEYTHSTLAAKFFLRPFSLHQKRLKSLGPTRSLLGGRRQIHNGSTIGWIALCSLQCYWWDGIKSHSADPGVINW